MRYFWILVLAGSLLLNIVAIWAFFNYVKYGGSPLGDIKRKLTGTTKQSAPRVAYAQENAELLAKIERGEADSSRIVFLGASITQRWDFEKFLPEFPLVNRGVGGQLVPGILARYKRDVLELDPKAVIIKFCSINVRPQMPNKVLEDGMTMLAQLAHSNDIVPIVSTIIPSGKPEARIGDFSVADSLSKFNDWVRAFAESNHYPIIDFAAAIGDENGLLPRDCSVDPVHLNDKGYQIVSDAARPVLREVLGGE
ncbi:MAG: GDSL-type esterase/lipase family protein [candidate division Zixibacteria bacterium]|nr:GDSL-type esterase/lipase family protein [candidate division Zixibacteria bacterium]MDH3936767.1 GDSL-type esterase/lipase family protein [candidate division Zixibacteria bacterium]MDH4032781.1 GDSL-type esterase/lipase family protein [candidate division Zixibacteria bacterium]